MCMYSIYIHTYVQSCMFYIYLYISKHTIHSKTILHYICDIQFCVHILIHVYIYVGMYVHNMAMQSITHLCIYTHIHNHIIYRLLLYSYSYRFVSSYKRRRFEFFWSSSIPRYVYKHTRGRGFVTNI